MSSGRVLSSTFSDIKQTVANIRQHVARGTTVKLLEDENFVFNMLKLMVEDGVDSGIKTEFLRVLEDCGGEVLDSKSVDEVVSNLFGIFRQYQDRDDCVSFLAQLLITVTTLIVSCKDVPSDPVNSLVEILWSIAGRLNDTSNRRLRAVSCQCLRQLEEFSPGLGWKWRDQLIQAVKQDRSDVCQDYVSLLTTVLHHIAGDIGEPTSPLTPKFQQDQRLSGNHTEILSAVSFIMEHSSVFTSAGLWDIILSLTSVLHNFTGISPSIFKPLMLHHMASADPCMLHVILHLQRQFSGEILSAAEEKVLLTRLMTAVNQKSISPAHRLLFLQWFKGYCELEDVNSPTLEHVREKLQPTLYPTVFDSVDLHVAKIAVLNISSSPRIPSDDKELSMLLSSLTLLRELTVSTGENKVSVSLYHSLYNLHVKHNTASVANAIIKICQAVLNSYPKLIPLVLDFLQCMRMQLDDIVVYMNILSSLHNQVLSSHPEDVLKQFHFYLLVLKVSAKEKQICPLNTLKYLLGLTEYAISVDTCSWHLGNAILAVCRGILLHHSTEGIYTELGDLLHEMMLNYLDIDIQDKARFYYALLTGASDEKVRDVLSDAIQGGSVTEKSFSSLLPGSMIQKMRTDLYLVQQDILNWERTSIKPIFTIKTVLPVSADVSQYYKWLDTISVHLQVKHSLQVVSHCVFDTLYVLSVNVETSDSYKQLKGIHVSSMNRNDSRELNVDLVPSEPETDSFKTSAMFSTENNDTYYCDLANTVISFRDLLFPYPWEQVGIEQHKRNLFYDNLWKHITSHSDPRDGIQSVMVLSCSLQRLQMEWDRYKVEQGSDCFLFFLPAKYHLLFKVQQTSDKMVISMATDYWQILTNVEEYLKCFE